MHEFSFITELLRHIQGSERVCRIKMMVLEGSLETSLMCPVYMRKNLNLGGFHGFCIFEKHRLYCFT